MGKVTFLKQRDGIWEGNERWAVRMCVVFTVATEKGQAEKVGKQVIEDKEDAMGETAEENRTVRGRIIVHAGVDRGVS